jgi:hypothetical protein
MNTCERMRRILVTSGITGAGHSCDVVLQEASHRALANYHLNS